MGALHAGLRKKLGGAVAAAGGARAAAAEASEDLAAKKVRWRKQPLEVFALETKLWLAGLYGFEPAGGKVRGDMLAEMEQPYLQFPPAIRAELFARANMLKVRNYEGLVRRKQENGAVDWREAVDTWEWLQEHLAKLGFPRELYRPITKHERRALYPKSRT